MDRSLDEITEGDIADLEAETGRSIEVPAGHPPYLLQTLAKFVKRPAETALIGRIIPQQSIIIVFGPPKCGKTFSICDLTMHASQGMSWHGCTVKRPLRIAYLAGEGVVGLKVRLRAWLDHHGFDDAGDAFRVLPQALSLPDCAADLVDGLRGFRPDIVVVDTLNTFFGGGNENDTKDMTSFCDAVRHLRDGLGCSVVIVHHSGHGNHDRERGSIVLRASADVVIQVAKLNAREDCIGFQVTLSRDLEPMETAISLRLVPFRTAWMDGEGNPITTCVVEAGEARSFPSMRGVRPLGDAQARVLKAVRELSQAGVADSKGEVQIRRSDVARLAKSQYGLQRQSVHSAWDALARRGEIRIVDPDHVAIRARR